MNILLVEDDVTLAMGIEYSLKNEGFNVKTVGKIKDAKEKIIVRKDWNKVQNPVAAIMSSDLVFELFFDFIQKLCKISLNFIEILLY